MSYVIHRDRLAAFLVDAAFYRSLPELVPLRAAAAAQHAQYVQRTGCCRDISVMFPSLQAAIDVIAAAKDDPDFVDRLRSFLTARLGKTVDQMLIFYRETSKGPVRRILLR